jgi:hypothetical protein
MTGADMFNWVRDGSMHEETFVPFVEAADKLAEAAQHIGSCHAHDSDRPEHARHCARCAVKQALAAYRMLRP